MQLGHCIDAEVSASMATRLRYVNQPGENLQGTRLRLLSDESHGWRGLSTVRKLVVFAAALFGLHLGLHLSDAIRPANMSDPRSFVHRPVPPATSAPKTGGGKDMALTAESVMEAAANPFEASPQVVPIRNEWKADDWRFGVQEAQRAASQSPAWASPREGTVFMVRTANPTDAMLSRMLAWAVQLRGTVNRVVFLVDVSKSDDIVANLSRAVGRHASLRLGHDVYISRSSDRGLRDAYPATDRVQVPKRGHWASRGPVYWFFVECLSLWYHTLRDEERLPIRNVWLLEDDVGWSGNNIGDLVNSYANETCDLVTVNANRHPKKPGPSGSWMFTNSSTSSFAEWGPHYEDKYSTRLQVQRYSARYLQAAHVLAKAGIIAVSELSSASIVHRLRLTYCDMLGRSSGIPYLSYTRVNPEQWEQLCRKAQDENNPRFYHALKW